MGENLRLKAQKDYANIVFGGKQNDSSKNVENNNRRLIVNLVTSVVLAAVLAGLTLVSPQILEL